MLLTTKRAAFSFTVISMFSYYINWMIFRNYDGDLFTDIFIPIYQGASIDWQNLHVFSPLTPFSSYLTFRFISVSPIVFMHIVGLLSILLLGYSAYSLSRYTLRVPWVAQALLGFILWNNGLYLVFRGIDDNSPQAGLGVFLLLLILRFSKSFSYRKAIFLFFVSSTTIFIHAQAIPFIVLFSLLGFVSGINRFIKNKWTILISVGLIPLMLFGIFSFAMYTQRTQDKFLETHYATNNEWSFFSKSRSFEEMKNWADEFLIKTAKFSSFHSDKGFSYILFALLIWLCWKSTSKKNNSVRALNLIYIYIYISAMPAFILCTATAHLKDG